MKSMIKTAKASFKKSLTVKPNYNWTFMPAISSQIHYTTKIPKARLIQTEILIEPASHMTTNFLNKKSSQNTSLLEK